MATSTENGWKGTLLKSDNSSKGNYMLLVGGHNIYLNTGRDYSALVGKPVNVTYKGTLDSFGLIDITRNKINKYKTLALMLLETFKNFPDFELLDTGGGF